MNGEEGVFNNAQNPGSAVGSTDIKSIDYIDSQIDKISDNFGIITQLEKRSNGNQNENVLKNFETSLNDKNELNSSAKRNIAKMKLATQNASLQSDEMVSIFVF